jgi:hypothetical protein
MAKIKILRLPQNASKCILGAKESSYGNEYTGQLLCICFRNKHKKHDFVISSGLEMYFVRKL